MRGEGGALQELEWYRFVSGIPLEQTPIEVTGVQRIYPTLGWTVPALRMTLEETGYTPVKIQQLYRHYYHASSIARAQSDLRDRISNRKYGSGAFIFRGEPKKNTKQDFCLQTGIISIYPSQSYSTFTVFYRTVELIKRFRGDIVFLQEILREFDFVFEKYPLHHVQFLFNNATWHPMFAPLLITYKWDENYWDEMRDQDARLFEDVAKWVWYYFTDKTNSIDKYSSGRQVKNILHKKLSRHKCSLVSSYFSEHSVRKRG